MLQITTKILLVLIPVSVLLPQDCTTSSTTETVLVTSTTVATTTASSTTPTPTSSIVSSPSPSATASSVTSPTAASTPLPTTIAGGGGGASTNAPGASSTVSTSGSTTAGLGATGSTVSSSTARSTTSTTPTTSAPAVCINQNCTGNLTCLDTNGATCLLGTGQCYQVVISNSTYSMVYTGCSETCEAVTYTAGEGYEEDKRCCASDKCNGGVINLGGSATSLKITGNLLACLSLLAMIIR